MILPTARQISKMARLRDAVRQTESARLRTRGGVDAGRSQSDTSWFGTIVDQGPEEEEDYSDNRYWVRRAFVTNSSQNRERSLKVEVEEDNLLDVTVTATNIKEILSGSHALVVGTVVRVFKARDLAVPSVTRYWIDADPTFILSLFLVLGEGFDELLCKPLGEEREVFIAKPWLLRRHPWDGKTVNGFRYEYLQGGERLSHQDETGEVERQRITMDYVLQDFGNEEHLSIIHAMPIIDDDLRIPGSEEIDFVDMNDAGRAWAAIPEEPARRPNIGLAAQGT